jgi:replicative DNA helicase
MSVTPIDGRRDAPEPEEDFALPPHDIASEQACLGAMMLSADVLAQCLEMLTADAFFRPAHQLVLAAIAALAERAEPADWLTVKAELERRGNLAQAGGPLATHDLTDAVPSAAQGTWYARRLLELQSQRDHLLLGRRILQLAADSGLSAAERHDQASDLVEDITDPGPRSGPVTAAALIGPLMDALEAGPDSIPGLAFGWQDVDEIIPGLRGGEVTVVGGRPGMGKSVVLLNVAAHAALRLGVHVLAITLEMSPAQYMDRLLAAEGNIELTRIRERNLTDADWDRAAKAHAVISGASTLHILRSSEMSPQRIRAELRALRRAGTPAGLVCLDYLQLMEAAMMRESRQLEVAGLSRALKNICGDEDIPFLVGSQLNRGPDLRSDHRPTQADLRESGAIENDADNIILLYRDEKYHPASTHAGEIDFIVEKNRQGKELTATLAWRGSYARCDDLWSPTSALEGR